LHSAVVCKARFEGYQVFEHDNLSMFVSNSKSAGAHSKAKKFSILLQLHLLLSEKFRVTVKTVQSNSGELAGYVYSFPYSGHPSFYDGLLKCNFAVRSN